MTHKPVGVLVCVFVSPHWTLSLSNTLSLSTPPPLLLVPVVLVTQATLTTGLRAFICVLRPWGGFVFCYISLPHLSAHRSVVLTPVISVVAAKLFSLWTTVRSSNCRSRSRRRSSSSSNGSRNAFKALDFRWSFVFPTAAVLMNLLRAINRFVVTRVVEANQTTKSV